VHTFEEAATNKERGVYIWEEAANIQRGSERERQWSRLLLARDCREAAAA
jgi:hypothetical protein